MPTRQFRSSLIFFLFLMLSACAGTGTSISSNAPIQENELQSGNENTAESQQTKSDTESSENEQQVVSQNNSALNFTPEILNFGIVEASSSQLTKTIQISNRTHQQFER